FFSSRRRHTRSKRDWSSDVCSSDLAAKISSKLSESGRVAGSQVRSKYASSPVTKALKRERMRVSAVGAGVPSWYFLQHSPKVKPVPHGQRTSAGKGLRMSMGLKQIHDMSRRNQRNNLCVFASSQQRGFLRST